MGKPPLRKLLSKNFWAAANTFLISLSLAALVFAALSIKSIKDEQGEAPGQNTFLAVSDCLLLLLDIYQLARDLIRASGGGLQNLTPGVTAPTQEQAGEDVEMGMVGGGDGQGEAERGEEDGGINSWTGSGQFSWQGYGDV
jgi:hypothetical protein